MEEYRSDDEISQVAGPDYGAEYTVGDYMGWTFEGLFELIRGRAFRMSPSPTTRHQSVSMELTGNFFNYFKGKSCIVFSAPLDVYLIKPGEDLKKGKNVVQPDLLVICDKSKLKDFGCVGAPDLIVEIISPHSSTRDLKYKFALYEEYGVKEYWIVFPTERAIQVFTLDNNHYGAPKMFAGEDTASSCLFPGLKVKLPEIFRVLD